MVEDFTLPPMCAVGNLAPEARDDAYKTKRNTSFHVAAPGVLANDADPDGQPITARLTQGPQKARRFVFNSNGSFSYEPNPGFTGADSFTYVAQDGEVSSTTATVRIDVRRK